MLNQISIRSREKRTQKADTYRVTVSALDHPGGNALIEFALVLPLILMIFVGTIEFSRMFRVKEMMTLASREAAHEAFRECFDTERQLCSGTISKVDACLTYYAQRIDETVKNFLPGVTLTISMYVWDSKTQTADMIGITLDQNKQYTRTDYDQQKVKANFKELLEKQEVIVIGEVYYDFPLFFNAGIIPDLELYDVTIF